MPSCEKCWRDAGADPYGDHAARYREFVETHDCSPEEQAGRFAYTCKQCHRKTIHQHAGVCMNPDCPSRVKP